MPKLPPSSRWDYAIHFASLVPPLREVWERLEEKPIFVGTSRAKAIVARGAKAGHHFGRALFVPQSD